MPASLQSILNQSGDPVEWLRNQQVGPNAYPGVPAEFPSPLPGVYTGELLRPYRAWLSANHYESRCSVGGSYVPESVEGYYLTPWDLG